MPRTNPPAQAGPGSPANGEPVYLVVGKLRRPHGLRGELLMEILTDFPERLKPRKKVYIGETHHPHTIASRRTHNDGLILGFAGYDTPEQAGELRNQFVYIQAAGLPALPEGEYYHHQLVGLTVVSDEGRTLGKLVEVLETGANDVYIIKDDAGAEILLPAIPPVILDINLDSATMRVHLLEGLLDD